MPVFSLSIHAEYRCRHSGACCRTPWDVPVELRAFRAIENGIATGQLIPPKLQHEGGPFLTDPAPPVDAVAVLRREHSACVFFDHESHLCSVHRALGKEALPSTCRIFPRIALTDARGTFITLSHYCPTAAAMLFRPDARLEIVESPDAFPPADYEGLNAVGELPPLLHSSVLMDLDGYGAWERHAVDVFARAATPESALATIARDARSLLTWRPSGTSLAAAIDELDRDLVPVMPSRWGGFARVVCRYLGTHAFANWMAYQGRGLPSWVRSVAAAEHVLANECFGNRERADVPLTAERLTAAIRSADFYLRHAADRQALVDEWNAS